VKRRRSRPTRAPLLALVLAAMLAACATPPGPVGTPLPPRSQAEVAAGNEVVLAALTYLDVGYQTGGNSAAEGFDCSGFTRHVYGSVLGLALPRRAEAQAQQSGWLPVMAIEDLEPGDMVFFNTLRRRYSHVGIYVGDGRFIHAPRTGSRVRVEGLRLPYWASRFDGGRRAAGAGLAGAEPSP
jgi:cell wall-associated NlpC family hydrolase